MAKASTKTSKRKASPKQLAGLAKGRAAAKAKHPAGAQTPKQLASERANLVLARAAQAQTHVKRKATPAQHAAEIKNLAKARLVEKTKHGKGNQTPKQLAAERNNLAKARAAYIRKYGHAYGSHRYTHGRYGRRKSDGVPALRAGVRPLGMHRISSTFAHHLTVRKPTGINPRFKARIAPTSFDQRGTWKKSHSHHPAKRLHMRKKRLDHVKHWRRRGHRMTPR
jgi:uncharacterized membrane protein YccC